MRGRRGICGIVLKTVQISQRIGGGVTVPVFRPGFPPRRALFSQLKVTGSSMGPVAPAKSDYLTDCREGVLRRAIYSLPLV
jgi:hypothetical protein